jgi:hypothetical protein
MDLRRNPCPIDHGGRAIRYTSQFLNWETGDSWLVFGSAVNPLASPTTLTVICLPGRVLLASKMMA